MDLAVNKDVQDAILKDPVRSKIVDIIDIEQWFYHNKGEYAPAGGVNMAQRQYLRKIRTGGARFEDVYRAVNEYRTQYPDKAVIYSAQKYPEMGWASLLAGGSCAAIPIKDNDFLKVLATMRPRKTENAYLLEGPKDILCYKDQNNDTPLTLQGKYTLYEIDEKSGSITKKRVIKGDIPLKKKGIYWLRKK